MYWVCKRQINPRGGADDTQSKVLMAENDFQSQPPAEHGATALMD